MTKADQLRALLPAITNRYWGAASHAMEHAAAQLMDAILGREPSGCQQCARMTARQFAATAEGRPWT